MISGTPSQPALIQRPDQLSRLVEILQESRRIAVDTESNSLYAYQEQVCLLQFSTEEADYLLDPLAFEDLNPLAPLFNDPNIEKIFHAAEYDLICLKRDFGLEFANLFDTMVAARIGGRKAVGLGSLLSEEFGVRQNKRHQRANWGQRPLPDDLLNYARMDTHYLIPLRDILYKELKDHNLLELAKEDFNRLCEIETNGGKNNPENVRNPDPWRISGAHDLNPRQAAVLWELCVYRERTAREINRPLFKVINDQTLLSIAQAQPMNKKELSKLRGMSARQVNRHGDHLLRAVQRGLKADSIYPPRSPRPKPFFTERLEALRGWRKKTARKMGVESDVVLPRDLMLSLAEEGPQDLEALAEVLNDVPWRLEHFGEQILATLGNKDNG